MTVPRYSDIFLYGGGRCLERFGVPFWRLSRAQDIPAIFTRTGADGAAFTPSGVREYDANRLRVEWVYNSTTGLWERALALHPAVNNQVLRSQELDNAAWGGTGTTVVANNGTAPDGTVTADRIQETAGGSSHDRFQTGWNPADDVWGVASVFLRAQEVVEVRVELENRAAGANGSAFFRLDTGVIGSLGGDARPFIYPFPDGWYRCGLATDSQTGGNTPLIRISLSDGNEDITYSGDVNNGVLAWGAMIQDASEFVGSYIPTVAAARNFAGETLYCPFPRRCFGFSVLLDFVWDVDGYVNGLNTLFHVGDAAMGTPRLQLRVDTGDLLTIDHDNGVDNSATASSAALTTPRPGDRVKVLAVLNPDGSVQGAHSVNGGAVTTWGPSAAPAAGLATEWADARFYPFHYNGQQGPARLLKVIGARGSYTLAELDTPLA